MNNKDFTDSNGVNTFDDIVKEIKRICKLCNIEEDFLSDESLIYMKTKYEELKQHKYFIKSNNNEKNKIISIIIKNIFCDHFNYYKSIILSNNDYNNQYNINKYITNYNNLINIVLNETICKYQT